MPRDLALSYDITVDMTRHFSKNISQPYPGIPLALKSRVCGDLPRLYSVDHLDGELPVKAFSLIPRRREYMHTPMKLLELGIRGVPGVYLVLAW